MSIIGLLFLTAVAGFFLFLRYLDYSVRRDRQKSLAQLAALPCPRCGVPLGFDAADAARKEGGERMAEAMAGAHKRGVRLRVVMLWPATCRQCGHRFIFRPDSRNDQQIEPSDRSLPPPMPSSHSPSN